MPSDGERAKQKRICACWSRTRAQNPSGRSAHYLGANGESYFRPGSDAEMTGQSSTERETSKYISAHLAYNNLSNVEVYPLALSDKPGVMTLYGQAETASFISGWGGASKSDHQTVSVTTLDIIAAERFRGVPLTIKLDVEGFELEVLKGADRTLRLNPKPAWLVEIFLTDSAIPGGVNERFLETFEVFWGSGYRSYDTSLGRSLVQPSDVNRWVKTGLVDRSSSNCVLDFGCGGGFLSK